MTESLRKFIEEHANDDLPELLVNASHYPNVNVKEAAIQIKAREQIKEKLPSWYRNDRLIYPSSLSAEQCSSEITACYKQRFVQCDDWLCDLTGGLGVDAYFLSKKARFVTFVEKDKNCCDIAIENFRTLGADNIQVINIDALDFLKSKEVHKENINIFYIDPSRRSSGNKRLYAINDCEPDLLKVIALLPNPYRLVIKLSPMLDITQVLTQIPSVREIHVVAIKNECKELLIFSESLASVTPAMKGVDFDPEIYCANFGGDGTEQEFCFHLRDEHAAIAPIAKNLGRYLYEPNASILKAGAYKAVALQHGVEKIHISSHLYTSVHPVLKFPGRIFEITGVLPFNNRMCKTIHRSIPQANISVRNFPLSVDELRKRTCIADGGDVYLYGTTLSDKSKVLIICRKF